MVSRVSVILRAQIFITKHHVRLGFIYIKFFEGLWTYLLKIHLREVSTSTIRILRKVLSWSLKGNSFRRLEDSRFEVINVDSTSRSQDYGEDTQSSSKITCIHTMFLVHDLLPQFFTIFGFFQVMPRAIGCFSLRNCIFIIQREFHSLHRLRSFKKCK